MCFPHYDPKHQRYEVSEIVLMTTGPGPLERWEDRLTETERKGVDEANAELDAFYAQLEASGLLRGADGGSSIEQVLGRAGPTPLRDDSNLAKTFGRKVGDVIKPE